MRWVVRAEVLLALLSLMLFIARALSSTYTQAFSVVLIAMIALVVLPVLRYEGREEIPFLALYFGIAVPYAIAYVALFLFGQGELAIDLIYFFGGLYTFGLELAMIVLTIVIVRGVYTERGRGDLAAHAFVVAYTLTVASNAIPLMLVTWTSPLTAPPHVLAFAYFVVGSAVLLIAAAASFIVEAAERIRAFL